MTKAGVFFHNGLGDGINGLVLSQNLFLNGWEVDTFQNSIGSMQNWFPHLLVKSYPPLSELSTILSSYDHYFVVYNSTCPFVQELMKEGKRRFPDRMKIFYFYPSKNVVKEAYYTDCRVNPDQTIRENLEAFCRNILYLPRITSSNGFIPPSDLVHRKFINRICVHPTSSKVGSNWPKESYVKLALHLKKKGFNITFIPGFKDLESWKDVEKIGFELKDFPHLDGLTRYIYESGYFIGNDSGLGHLASSSRVPTLTFCRRRTLANLWRPSFYPGIVLTPSRWIPNIRGFRLRDQHWKKFISVGRAKRAFEKLQKI